MPDVTIKSSIFFLHNNMENADFWLVLLQELIFKLIEETKCSLKTFHKFNFFDLLNTDVRL